MGRAVSFAHVFEKVYVTQVVGTALSTSQRVDGRE